MNSQKATGGLTDKSFKHVFDGHMLACLKTMDCQHVSGDALLVSEVHWWGDQADPGGPGGCNHGATASDSPALCVVISRASSCQPWSCYGERRQTGKSQISSNQYWNALILPLVPLCNIWNVYKGQRGLTLQAIVEVKTTFPPPLPCL